MKVEIRKTAAQHEIKIRRDDGVILALRPVDRKFSPPHDVVHLIAERSLGLRNGFWGTIAAGAKFPQMAVVEGRQRPHAAESSKAVITSNRLELRQAEVLVGILQEVLRKGARNPVKLIDRRFKAQGTDLAPSEIKHLWTELMTVRKQWEDLAQGQCMAFDWPAHKGPRSKRKR